MFLALSASLRLWGTLCQPEAVGHSGSGTCLTAGKILRWGFAEGDHRQLFGLLNPLRTGECWLLSLVFSTQHATG